MANEEVLGPRKTMFILVIVVGCFAVLWPRLLSPLLLGNTKEQLKPNKFDREAGCCEVLFESEMAVLELVSEVCSSAVGADGKLSPYAAAECRRTVNTTCGVDIIGFLKRSDNVGQTTKVLLETMKKSNSSCFKEHFGVPTWSLNTHIPVNSWVLQLDNVKQERPITRVASPHPALREKGRAIPAGAPTPPSRGPVPLPSHARVRSPLSVYFEYDIKPPPIPGMRPPLGSAGGPVTAPKSSMGFVMPIYTICIIVFFVYTLSKILFKRTGSVTYETVSPDPQFRRRVFRDESRSSPETKLVVSAISGLVAEVRQQMEAGPPRYHQRAQDAQDELSRPYTNGSVHVNNSPVNIITTEYRDSPKKDLIVEKESTPQLKESTPESKEPTPELKEPTPEPEELSPEPEELSPEPEELSPEPEELTPEPEESTPEPKESTPEPKESTPEPEELKPEPKEQYEKESLLNGRADFEPSVPEGIKLSTGNGDLKRPESLTDASKNLITSEANEEVRIRSTPDLEASVVLEDQKKLSTPELLAEALREDTTPKEDLSEEEVEEEVEEEEEADEEGNEPETSTVKVLGMETTAHTADGGAWPRAEPPLRVRPQRPAPRAPRTPVGEDVPAIFLQTEIPQQSRVLVAECKDRAEPHKHSPLVVSGKMTLSLIQDTPRDTPERDLESTADDFTTASALTQAVDEDKEELSDEEVEEEEEIEIEEIEEEEEDESPEK